MTPPEIHKRLQSRLTQERIGAVKLAAEALGRSADDSAAEQMTERFGFLCEDGPGRDPGCHIRAKLAFALGRLEYSPAAEVLRVGIRTVQVEAVGGVPFDTGAFLRANCALALAQIRDPDCVRDIALLLFDRSGRIAGAGDPTVKMEPRKAAAQALAITGSIAVDGIGWLRASTA